MIAWLSGCLVSCPPGFADGVIYCYQTLEHIKHFITCRSAAWYDSAGKSKKKKLLCLMSEAGDTTGDAGGNSNNARMGEG